MSAEIIRELKREAAGFLQSGLSSYTGYWPNDFYGNEAQRYYQWSKRVYDLISKLPEQPKIS